MNKELIKKINDQIGFAAIQGGDPDLTNFPNNRGVLLTCNEAKQCLAALEGREQALNASVSAIYFADGSDYLTYHYGVVAALTGNDDPDREDIKQMFAELNPTT